MWNYEVEQMRRKLVNSGGAAVTICLLLLFFGTVGVMTYKEKQERLRVELTAFAHVLTSATNDLLNPATVELLAYIEQQQGDMQKVSELYGRYDAAISDAYAALPDDGPLHAELVKVLKSAHACGAISGKLVDVRYPLDLIPLKGPIESCMAAREDSSKLLNAYRFIYED